MGSMYLALDGLTADGVSKAVSLLNDRKLFAQTTSSNYGGTGILRFQLSPDDGVTWVDLETADEQLSTNGVIDTVVPNLAQARLSFAGGTSPNITAWTSIELDLPASAKAGRSMYPVFSSLTAIATSGALMLKGDRNIHVVAAGTFGTAALKIQLSPDGSQWVDAPTTPVSLTKAGRLQAVVPNLGYVRLDVSGVTTGTDINVWSSVPIPSS